MRGANVIDLDRDKEKEKTERLQQNLKFLKKTLKTQGKINKLLFYPRNSSVVSPKVQVSANPLYRISEKEILNASVNIDQLNKTPLSSKRFQQLKREFSKKLKKGPSITTESDEDITP